MMSRQAHLRLLTNLRTTRVAASCSGWLWCQGKYKFPTHRRIYLVAQFSSQTFNREDVSGPHGSYVEEYTQSIQDPQAFWKRAAQDLHWFQEPSNILSNRGDDPNFYQWFSDGVINTSYNCLDVHVANGRGDQVALIFDSPLTATKSRRTYSELLQEVSIFAGALEDQFGVVAGDTIVIYCPPIPEAVVAMLACSRIGAVHSVVFGGFAAPELATRIADCTPKVIISASAGIEPHRIVPYKPLLDQALELVAASTGANSKHVARCVIIQRDNVERCELVEPRDVDFRELIEKQTRPADAVPLPSTHPHYILYTSGTTGVPKGIVRDTGSYAVALKYSMSAFYDTNPGEVFWAASDIGWVVGHSYIVYAPLLHGCTTILYEGKPVGTPDAGAFWRVIEEYSVKAMFVAPTALRAINQADPRADLGKQYDVSSLKTIFLAGEHSDPDTLHWCETTAFDDCIPAIDHWWQTELGWPGVGNAVGLGHFPAKYGACAAPVPGFALDILDDDGQSVLQQGKTNKNELGNMVLKLPLPPGALATLYKNDERFVESYLTRYPGYYDTGDVAYIDDAGYVFIMGRTDDVINTAGHRLSTGSMEEILMEHDQVADCAVIGVKDKLKGQVPIGFVTLIAHNGEQKDPLTIQHELIQSVRDTLGPVAAFKKVGIVKALPKTRSGKILRGTMTNIANGDPYTITPTVEDPNIFEYLEPEIIKLVES